MTSTGLRASARTACPWRRPRGPLAVVERLGGRAPLDADHRRGVEHSPQLSVVSPRSVKVAGSSAGVASCGREAGVTGEMTGSREGGHQSSGHGLAADTSALPAGGLDSGGELTGRSDLAVAQP
jgi:hypothetical protein